MESSIIAKDQNNQISLHFTQRLYFPYYISEEYCEFLPIEHVVDFIPIKDNIPDMGDTNFCWWKNPFTKPDIYGF
jgi:hypothetical protein